MRICLYTDSALPKLGVQEQAVDGLARAFTALGHQAVVLAPWPKSGTPGANVPYPVLRHPRFFATHFLAAWYRWFLQNHHAHYPFDVLHCHGVYPPGYLAALTRPALRAPMIVTSHGGDLQERSGRLKNPRIVERIVAGLQSADALVAISPWVRERLTQLCPEAAPRIVDLPNGVNMANFAERIPRPDDLDRDIVPGAYAICHARLKHRSGIDSLLQALARTPANGHVQLVLLGEGEDRALLAVLTEQLDLCTRVRFLGNAPQPIARYLLQNARFGVVAARRWDASGAVILEGYASGLPMIATDLPGWSDLVQHDRTGFLVSPNAPEDLAEAMTRLFAEDALVQRMRIRALAFVKSYDWQTIAERHVALYQNLLPGRLTRAA